MTDLTKNFEQLSSGDLMEACRRRKIPVPKDGDREIMLKSLQSKPDKK